MQELTRQQRSHIVGGNSEMFWCVAQDGGGGWSDVGGFGADGQLENITWGGNVSIGDSQGAVVVVTGSAGFDNIESFSPYGVGEAPWEGAYLGHWVDAPPLSYEHTAIDGALVANAGRLTGAAAALFIENVLAGAEIGGAVAGPIGLAAGIVIGTGVGMLAYYALQEDHPKGGFSNIAEP